MCGSLPVLILNTGGYYDGFVEQIRRAHADKLLHKRPDEFVQVVSDPIAALDWCEAHAADANQLADTVVVAAQALGPCASRLPPARAVAWLALGAVGGAMLALLGSAAMLRRNSSRS